MDVAEKRRTLGGTVKKLEALRASRAGWLDNVLENFNPEAERCLHWQWHTHTSCSVAKKTADPSRPPARKVTNSIARTRESTSCGKHTHGMRAGADWLLDLDTRRTRLWMVAKSEHRCEVVNIPLFIGFQPSKVAWIVVNIRIYN